MQTARAKASSEEVYRLQTGIEVAERRQKCSKQTEKGGKKAAYYSTKEAEKQQTASRQVSRQRWSRQAVKKTAF